jgi:DNA-binding NarL/FixJ family response regulator
LPAELLCALEQALQAPVSRFLMVFRVKSTAVIGARQAEVPTIVVHLDSDFRRFRLPKRIRQRLASNKDALTEREIEVLKLIAKGFSNKLVAERLSITEDTVKGHVRNVLSKLNASDRTHAVTIALRRAFFDL